MGIYYIPCENCGNTFPWFSGNPLQQKCNECQNKLKPLVMSENIIQTESKRWQRKIKIFKLNPEAKLPTRNLSTDAGADLYALNDVFVKVGTTEKINTGVAVNIPINYVGYVMRRSSMAIKGLESGVGVIDTGYSGDCSVVLHNINNKQDHDVFGNYGYQVKKGNKIAQIVIQPCLLGEVEEVTELWQSERGNKGFGSSGV